MPEIKFQDGSTLRDMTAIKYQDGATLRTITEAWFQDGSTLRKVWPAVPPLDGYGTGGYGSVNNGTAVAYTTSPKASVVASGGVPPYSYLWSLVSGTNMSIYGSATGSDVNIQQTASPLGVRYTGSAQCVITDSASNTKTVSVPVTIDRAANLVVSTSDISSAAFLPVPKDTVLKRCPSPSVSGGIPPYSYSWTISGSDFYIDNPSLQRPFVCAARTINSRGSYVATLTLTVTDSVGASKSNFPSHTYTLATS